MSDESLKGDELRRFIERQVQMLGTCSPCGHHDEALDLTPYATAALLKVGEPALGPLLRALADPKTGNRARRDAAQVVALMVPGLDASLLSVAAGSRLLGE